MSSWGRAWRRSSCWACSDGRASSGVRAIGFTPRRIVALVALETLFIGAIAVLAGLAAGAARNPRQPLGGIDVRIVGGDNLEG